jgi:hypothetical protein
MHQNSSELSRGTSDLHSNRTSTFQPGSQALIGICFCPYIYLFFIHLSDYSAINLVTGAGYASTATVDS